ncbi:uncharacterized protein KD926_000267, partial [Aspergillus affinis]|uniref:uncharacterized protein n=1 Tax=Aspergillus affinis TaxID=1070780 RepID=UPI0022FEB766
MAFQFDTNDVYVIALASDHRIVLKANGEVIHFRQYQERAKSQHFAPVFHCEEYGLRNVSTGKFLGVNDHNQISCKSSNLNEWENLVFHARDNGYCVTVHKDGHTGVFARSENGDYLDYKWEWEKRVILHALKVSLPRTDTLEKED